MKLTTLLAALTFVLATACTGELTVEDESTTLAAPLDAPIRCTRNDPTPLQETAPAAIGASARMLAPGHGGNNCTGCNTSTCASCHGSGDVP